ncbi:hypothetical protein CHGG_07463 [Chaetomium globosum CBS 148.51]|uniref:Pectate lyase C n=1 Tax=Chaetomium globosum (strain ATCC 6205 / CBS 148.51 / DSM 1962 / NBRC 6347 / NRRL 1970) TaxID=306901 RepID=Q2GX41_CHAGB|nr:uncharacterized protein CHGG_07463 [Chaetomium globosum CBS 148.51]EAQ86210.1 hypothetical protein CHGG_07463 [Chaetomium globosum CBS 148.51]
MVTHYLECLFTMYCIRGTDKDDSDAGSGSLRDAVSQANRIVVFTVGGVINISSRIVVSKNTYIAGQTAPGDGRDETFSISGTAANITVQNTIIAQGLETHSCGGLMETDGGISLFRNLYIDNKTRNPKVKGVSDFQNNVIYDWGGGGGYIAGDSSAASYANIINNSFISGPSTSLGLAARSRDGVDTALINQLKSWGKSGALISDESSMGGPGTISGGTAPADADGDGIPDAWERSNGLDPNDASDAMRISSTLHTPIVPCTSTSPGVKIPTHATTAPPNALYPPPRAADQKIPRRHPALCNNILAQQGDDDGPAAEDDGAGEVHVGEEAVEEGCGSGEGAAQGEGGDEGEQEEGDGERAGAPVASPEMTISTGEVPPVRLYIMPAAGGEEDDEPGQLVCDSPSGTARRAANAITPTVAELKAG